MAGIIWFQAPMVTGVVAEVTLNDALISRYSQRRSAPRSRTPVCLGWNTSLRQQVYLKNMLLALHVDRRNGGRSIALMDALVSR
jgi:hypothetical protein